MSTRRGANQRDRPQKYKNRTAFKNDLHDKRWGTELFAPRISEVCEHCKAVIEWKIKYKKYKPLSQAKTCVKCSQRTVKKAYHVMCTECALKLRCCAKCNKSADEAHITPPAPTTQEQMRLDSEMKMLLKTLPERKRRTFLRYMKKGKKKDGEAEDEAEEKQQNGDGDADGSGSDPEVDEIESPNAEKEELAAAVPEKEETIPYTKEELLKKLEQLKLALANDDEDDDFFGSEFDDDDDEEDDDDEDSDYSEDEKEPEKAKKEVTFG